MTVSQLTTRSNQRGATVIEYALIVGLLAVVIIAGVTLLGGGIETGFTDVSETIANPDGE